MANNEEIKKEEGASGIDDEREEEKAKKAIAILAEAFGVATEKTVKAINYQNKLDNVAIFVDYDNVYYELEKFQHHPDHEDPDKNLFLKLWDKYGRDNVRLFRAYADFQQTKTDLTRLQKKRVQVCHVYANGKVDRGRKNASDIELCIDAIETTYTDPNITCYVFVTADSDMIPIMNRLMYKGKRVEIFYPHSDAAPQHDNMRNYAHESYDLLAFLNVDTSNVVNLENYIEQAIQAIYDWHETHKNNDELYFGKKFMHTCFIQSIKNMTPGIASRLVDYIIKEQIVKEEYKNGTNSHYVLNNRHKKVIAFFETKLGEGQVASN